MTPLANLRSIEPAHNRIERRPRWTSAQCAQQKLALLGARSGIDRSIPAPRCDHREHEDPALAEQSLISVRIVLAHLFGHMSEVELDRPAATRLEVYEQQAVLRA